MNATGPQLTRTRHEDPRVFVVEGLPMRGVAAMLREAGLDVVAVSSIGQKPRPDPGPSDHPMMLVLEPDPPARDAVDIVVAGVVLDTSADQNPPADSFGAFVVDQALDLRSPGGPDMLVIADRAPRGTDFMGIGASGAAAWIAAPVSGPRLAKAVRDLWSTGAFPVVRPTYQGAALLVRDAERRQHAIDAINEATVVLEEIEGRGIERGIVEEIALPALNGIRRALELEFDGEADWLVGRRGVDDDLSVLERTLNVLIRYAPQVTEAAFKVIDAIQKIRSTLGN